MAILERVVTVPVDGLQPWFVKRVAELVSAVGRVSARHRLGTGFLIAPRLLLTCHQILPDAATANAGSSELDYQSDEDGTFRLVTTVKLQPERCFYHRRGTRLRSGGFGNGAKGPTRDSTD